MNTETLHNPEVPRLPRRAREGHKGTYGRVLIVAGSRGMSGAAILCGRAALRGGAGLVQVATAACVEPIVAAGNPCYMTFAIRQLADGSFSEGTGADLLEIGQPANVLAIGPGLGQSPSATLMIRELVAGLPDTPAVLDADALNAFAPFLEEFKGRAATLVLTPHPGEFARLTGTAAPATDEQRREQAVAFAQKFGVVLVLKGSRTIVTDGRRVYANTTGNPGMATGGTGDVLTGLIAALIAQKMEPFDAAVLGVWVHGRAGDLVAERIGEASLIATDLMDYFPDALNVSDDDELPF